MSENPILQASIASGEPNVTVRISSANDIALAPSLFEAFKSQIVPRMRDLQNALKTDGLSLIQSEMGGTVIAEYPPPPAPEPSTWSNYATPATQAPPMPPAPPSGGGGTCTQGPKGPHQMTCRYCLGPVGPRKQMGQWMGHACVNNPQDRQNNPDGCKPTWCN